MTLPPIMEVDKRKSSPKTCSSASIFFFGSGLPVSFGFPFQPSKKRGTSMFQRAPLLDEGRWPTKTLTADHFCFAAGAFVSPKGSKKPTGASRMASEGPGRTSDARLGLGGSSLAAVCNMGIWSRELFFLFPSTQRLKKSRTPEVW